MKKNTINIQLNFSFCLLLTLIFFSNNLFAKKTIAKSIDEFKSVINKSSKGDSVVLINGTYKDAGLININSNAIFIMAEKLGGVVFTGNSLFKINGSENTFCGFQFLNGDIGSDKEKLIEIIGNYNNITQCNFVNITSHNYIHFEEGSHHNQLSYCNIEKKPAVHNAGPAIQITTSETVVNHTWIHHCTFQNFEGDGGDFGNEPIRIGLGKEQNNVSGAIVEYCYFENLGLADNETISVKSTSNVIRYNTFNNNPLGQVTFRTGNRNTAYGNYFINSGGIRIKEGEYHSVYNNYFQGKGDDKFATIKLMNFKMNQKTNLGLPLNHILIYHNSFYNSGAIELGGEGANPPKDVFFENNIFYKKEGSIFSDINNNVNFQNNLYFGGATLGVDTKSGEFFNKDPQLIEHGNVYSLSSKSTAIDASIESNPSIFDNPEVDDDPMLLLDIEGQKRSGKKDIGCDEFSKLSTNNKLLTKTNVGPFYLSKKQ